MPGGFTSSGGERDGYQAVEEPVFTPSIRSHAPPSTAPTAQPNAPGAYQSV